MFWPGAEERGCPNPGIVLQNCFVLGGLLFWRRFVGWQLSAKVLKVAVVGHRHRGEFLISVDFSHARDEWRVSRAPPS